MDDEKYVAQDVITVNGVRAYNPGDEVPADNRERVDQPDRVVLASEYRPAE